MHQWMRLAESLLSDPPYLALSVSRQIDLCVWPFRMTNPAVRSGAEISMLSGQVLVYTITMIGHWSSGAFLEHIRKQVE